MSLYLETDQLILTFYVKVEHLSPDLKMCGRYALPIEPENLPSEFGKQHLEVDQQLDTDRATSHRYNIGPTEYAPVYYMRLSIETKERYSETAKHLVRYMKWGMIPKWIKGKSELNSRIPTFNARYENIDKNRLWVSSINQRCVIPIKGYYEWKKIEHPNGKIQKQPYYIKRKDEKLMFLAGLYSRSVIEGKDVFSYTIITWNAPKCLAWLHDRMPVVLDPETDDFEKWLDSGGEKKHWKDVKDFLKIYDGKSGKLEWYAVDRKVGNMKNEDPTFVKPLDDSTGIMGLLGSTVKRGFKIKPESKSNSKAAQSSKVKEEPVDEINQHLSPQVKKEKVDTSNEKPAVDSNIKIEKNVRLKGKKRTLDNWLSPSKRRHTNVKQEK